MHLVKFCFVMISFIICFSVSVCLLKFLYDVNTTCNTFNPIFVSFFKIVHFIVTFCNMKVCTFFLVSLFWDGGVLDLPFLDGGRARSPFPEILDLTLPCYLLIIWWKSDHWYNWKLKIKCPINIPNMSVRHRIPMNPKSSVLDKNVCFLLCLAFLFNQ